MKQFYFVLSLLFFTKVAVAEPVIDINKIAGKSENEVEKYLGKPISCGNNKYGKKCQYKKAETEVVFIQGKADWITVEGMDGVPFTISALSALGLQEAKPSFSDNFTLRWNTIKGIKEVSIFKGGTSSDYAYIKVKTK